MTEENNITKHARRELEFLRNPQDEPDDMQDAIEANVLQIVEIFAQAGHSGSSGKYTIGIIEKVLNFEPITPLTGSDEEWLEVGYGVWQNVRCGRVFKDTDGRAYDIEAIAYRDASGSTYLKGGERHYIKFPYRPTTRIVNEGEQLELDCYHKAEPGEPKFTLLARDPVAPDLIRLWASIREGNLIDAIAALQKLSEICYKRYYNIGGTDTDQLYSARDIADNMTQWQAK